MFFGAAEFAPPVESVSFPVSVFKLDTTPRADVTNDPAIPPIIDPHGLAAVPFPLLGAAGGLDDDVFADERADAMLSDDDDAPPPLPSASPLLGGMFTIVGPGEEPPRRSGVPSAMVWSLALYTPPVF